jgi:hypothetical protein
MAIDKKIISSSTSCRAVALAYSGDVGRASIKREFSNILSFYYQKSIAAPFGEFSLELPNSGPVSLYLSAGDWIGIFLNNGVDKESLRCLGNISRIQKKTSVANDGTKTTTWQIFGYDYGKYLQTYKIFADPQIAQDQQYQFEIMGDSALLKGPPSELVKNYFNKYLLEYSSVAYGSLMFVPEGFNEAFFPSAPAEINSIYQMVSMGGIEPSTRDETINLTLNVLQPLWTILKTLSNSMINELFLEMKGSIGQERPTMFLRPNPFCLRSFSGGAEYNKKFLDLEAVSVSSGDIIEQAIGISDSERQNFFKIFSAVVGSSLGPSAGIPPIADKDSIGRYGPCFATYQTSFIHGQADGVQLVLDWTDLVKHWYENNHKLENGIMTINGNPLVRAGKRLDVSGLYKKAKTLKSYYIEGYVDQWQFPGIWSQTLQLNRGIIVSENKEYYVKEFVDDESVETSSVFFDSKLRR